MRWWRALAALCVGVLASCGGGSGPNYAGIESAFDVQVTPSVVVAPRGVPVKLRVDLRGQTRADTPVGYAFDLAESAGDIDVATVPCPSDVGSAACQDWTITPGPHAVPGSYQVLVRSVGRRYLPADIHEETARFTLVVTGPQPTLGAIVVSGDASRGDALVITEDKRLWGRGANSRAQIDVGYSFTYLPDDLARLTAGTRAVVQPVDLSGFGAVQPAVAGDWSLVAANRDARFAVREVDGSLWGWGANYAGSRELGLPVNDRENEDRPVLISGVSGVAQITTGTRGTLVRTGSSGSVFAIGGKNLTAFGQAEAPLYGATPVPAALDAGGNPVHLAQASSIGGGSTVDGDGFAAAVKFDGSVWVWGARRYLQAAPSGVTYDALGFPKRVADLPGDVVEVAALGNSGNGVFLARTAGGRVWEGRGYSKPYVAPDASAAVGATQELMPSLEVAGIADAVEIALGGIDEIEAGRRNAGIAPTIALARLRDGRVLAWKPGETTPVALPGIASAIRLGNGYLITGECSGAAGAAWEVRWVEGAAVAVALGTFGADPTRCAAVPAGRLTVDASGPGRVRSSVPKIDCGNVCANTFPLGAAVDLYAIPDPGFVAKWQSCQMPYVDAGLGVVVGADTHCAVRFDAEPAIRLQVQREGAGTLVSSPAGIDCGTTCAADFAVTTVQSVTTAVVMLNASADPGWRLVSWSGPCVGGVLDLHTEIGGALPRSLSCTARFERIPSSVALSVTLDGTGSGTLVSDPPGIDCGATCSASFPFEAFVLLRPQPAPGSAFAGWSGDPDCRDGWVGLATAKACTGRFDLIAPPALPTDLRAFANGPVELTWTRQQGVVSYELTRAPGSGGEATRTVVFAGPADTYVDTAVTGDTLYRYELVARNGGGASPPASTLVRTPVATDWTRVGASDISANAGFGQPALALTADGNSLAVAQVVTGGGFDQTRVFANSTFSPSSWTTLNGSPGGALTPAAAGTQPSLALDSQGTATVAWTQGGGAGNDVRVARYDPATAQWVQLGGALDIDLGSAALNDATQPSLVLDAAGLPLVAWLQGGGAYFKRWDGTAWVGAANVAGAGAPVNGLKLVLDASGAAHILLRRGAGTAAQLFAYRESAGAWQGLGGALNAPLTAPRDSLQFFDLMIDVDGSPLAVWSEGAAPYSVLARRWRGGAWQPLGDLVAFENDYGITGLAVARSVQSAAIATAPPHVMIARQPVFAGSNPRNATGLVFLLDSSDTWQSRPTLLTSGPMFGLTLRVTRTASPVAAWLAETGAPGSGELGLFVWRSLY